jgi:glycosyltransferase involved in cell wall biosynthesis
MSIIRFARIGAPPGACPSSQRKTSRPPRDSNKPNNKVQTNQRRTLVTARYGPRMSTTVLTDAWHLDNASANRGIGTYLRNLLPLLATEPDFDVVGLTRRPDTLPTGVRARRIARWAPDRFAQREHELRLPFDLVRAARTEHADEVFSPADDPPSRCPVPWVQMLHDVIPLVVDDAASASGAERWRRIGPRLRTADAVITNSRCTAADASRVLGIDPGRIRVVPLGVGAQFRPALMPRDAAAPTILYVGEYGTHKGFAEAFAVAGALADAGFPHRLAMVGSLAPWHEPAVRALLARAPRPDRVDLLGFVDDIVGRYQAADALIVTSRYEGFCLPALEAMACGTPVVAFANSAIREIVDGAGVLVPDGDVAACASAVAHLLGDATARCEAIESGLRRAQAHTWEQCAHAHADVLRSVARATAR